jgi:hypothetical protein
MSARGMHSLLGDLLPFIAAFIPMLMLNPFQTLSSPPSWAPALEESLRGVKGSYTVVLAIPTIAILLMSCIGFRRTKRKADIKILLANEIASFTQRALEYCLRPRELMLRGYTQVCPINDFLEGISPFHTCIVGLQGP